MADEVAPRQAQGVEPPPTSLAANLMNIMRVIAVWWMLKTFLSGSPVVEMKESDSTLPSPETANFHLMPLWRMGTPCRFLVYLLETDEISDFYSLPNPVYNESLIYGDWNLNSVVSLKVHADVRIQNNGSLFAHLFLCTQTHIVIDPAASNYDPHSVIHKSTLLTRFMPERKVVKKRNLIGGQVEDEDEPQGDPSKSTANDSETSADITKDTAWVSYWFPNMTIALVTENAALPRNLPPAISKLIKMTSDGVFFYPTLHVNDFWMLNEYLQPINSTVDSLDLNIHIYPLSMFKFQMYIQMDESFRVQKDMMGSSVSEIDTFKRMVLETNPYLLAVTFLVSILHSFFDFLAFKNDIKFWKDKKDMEGMSLRALLMDLFFQTVILLYLFNNDTSWMILMSSCIGLAIEVWKLRRVVNIKIDRTSFFPRISLQEKVQNLKVSKTREYDALAFKYVSWALYPLLFGYAIYSLVYESHKSWYDFIINTLVGFVYAFGFIKMTPQLFINYKLKSVAHMPWKSFMYKALNTFIDDLFAFVIKMPTLHRLACLRDDAVFLVYLYQKWKYPVDKKRRNEFGQIGEINAAEEQPSLMEGDAELVGASIDDKKADGLIQRATTAAPETPVLVKDIVLEAKKDK